MHTEECNNLEMFDFSGQCLDYVSGLVVLKFKSGVCIQSPLGSKTNIDDSLIARKAHGRFNISFKWCSENCSILRINSSTYDRLKS